MAAGCWHRRAPSADGVTIEVSDNGVGMPPGAKAKIVGLFSQYDTRLRASMKASGWA